MNKEEILQASRKENQNKDIYELEIINKGQRIGGLTALCIAFVLMLTERLVFDATNYGYFCIILSAGAALFTYKAIKLKRKHEILFAAIWGILAIYAAVTVILGFNG